VLAGVKLLIESGNWSADDDIQAVSDYGDSATIQNGNGIATLSPDQAVAAYEEYEDVTSLVLQLESKEAG
jgi:hypothetical protein